MPDVLQATPLTLECLSPVHIGSGDHLGPLDFVRDGGRVLVMDQGKLLAHLGNIPALSETYVRFCESERPTLGDFVRMARISPSDFAAYTLRLTASVGRDILTFIKTPNGGVFIPGSSVKGAIRSALLHRVVSEEDAIRQAIIQEAIKEVGNLKRPVGGRRSAKLWKTSGTADRLAFGKDHNRDVMRIFQFADSRPVPPSDLILAEVRVLSVRSNALAFKEGRTGQPMRLTIETLPTGLRLESRLTWNGYLGEAQGPAASLGFGDRIAFVSAWLAHCNAVARGALVREGAFYRQFGEPALGRWHEELLNRLGNLKANQCLLRLGWGAGFDAMAVTNLFPPEETRRIRQGANLGKIGSDGPVEPFPKSRKVVWRDEKTLEPLGWILVTVGERPAVETRRATAAASDERTQMAEAKPHPQPSSRKGGPPQPPTRPRTSSKDVEVLRRSLEKTKEGGRKTEGPTKAGEKAKREQEKISRRYRGERDK